MPEKYDRFKHYLRAGFPVIWVNTLEPHRAEMELAQVIKTVRGNVGQHWDIVGGYYAVNANEEEIVKAVKCTPNKAITLTVEKEQTTTFLWNLHRFITSVEIIQTIENVIPLLKDRGCSLIILAPDSDKLPPELVRFTVIWDFPLPGRAEIEETMQKIQISAMDNANISVGAIGNPEPIIDAALGLTESEAEDAFSLALSEKNKLDASIVAREKANTLLRQAKIEMSTFTETFGGLGGLDIIKEYALGAAKSPMSLGILLLGPPGTGKSHFAKALGNELQLPTLSMDFGKMMSSLVGSSESNVRAALQAVDAMGRTILYLDEIEKGLAGVQSSGQLDSGVKAGVGSAYLRWMSDREPGKTYVVGTCNDIKALPPEYTRSGRWDAVFWLDLPNEEERDVIWKIYQTKYKLSGPRPDDKDWTGAEIFSCCRTAMMLNCDLVKAGTYIIPMARTMAEKINDLREWAKGRAIPASKQAVYVSSGRKLTLN